MRHRHWGGSEIDFGSAARPPAEDWIPLTDGESAKPGLYQVAWTTHHERRALTLMEPTEMKERLDEKEVALAQVSTKSSYRLFVGVDIAYRTFTAASLVPGAKPQRASKPFEQTPQGFEHFQSH